LNIGSTFLARSSQAKFHSGLFDDGGDLLKLR
jgi:hypothetical protein